MASFGTIENLSIKDDLILCLETFLELSPGSIFEAPPKLVFFTLPSNTKYTLGYIPYDTATTRTFEREDGILGRFYGPFIIDTEGSRAEKDKEEDASVLRDLKKLPKGVVELQFPPNAGYASYDTCEDFFGKKNALSKRSRKMLYQSNLPYILDYINPIENQDQVSIQATRMLVSSYARILVSFTKDFIGVKDSLEGKAYAISYDKDINGEETVIRFEKPVRCEVHFPDFYFTFLREKLPHENDIPPFGTLFPSETTTYGYSNLTITRNVNGKLLKLDIVQELGIKPDEKRRINYNQAKDNLKKIESRLPRINRDKEVELLSIIDGLERQNSLLKSKLETSEKERQYYLTNNYEKELEWAALKKELNTNVDRLRAEISENEKTILEYKTKLIDSQNRKNDSEPELQTKVKNLEEELAREKYRVDFFKRLGDTWKRYADSLQATLDRTYEDTQLLSKEEKELRKNLIDREYTIKQLEVKNEELKANIQGSSSEVELTKKYMDMTIEKEKEFQDKLRSQQEDFSKRLTEAETKYKKLFDEYTQAEKEMQKDIELMRQNYINTARERREDSERFKKELANVERDRNTDFFTMQDQIESLQKRVVSLKDDASRMRDLREEAEEEIDDLKQNLSDALQKLSDAQSIIKLNSNNAALVRDLQNIVQKSKEREKNLEETIESMYLEHFGILRRISVIKKARDRNAEKIKLCEEMNTKLSDTIRRNEISLQDLSKTNSKLKIDLDASNKRIRKLEKELEKTINDNSQLDASNTERGKYISKLTVERNEAETRLKKIERDYKKLRGDFEIISEDNQTLKEAKVLQSAVIRRLEEELKSCKDNHSRLQKSLNRVEEELRWTNETRKRAEETVKRNEKEIEELRDISERDKEVISKHGSEINAYVVEIAKNKEARFAMSMEIEKLRTQVETLTKLVNNGGIVKAVSSEYPKLHLDRDFKTTKEDWRSLASKTKHFHSGCMKFSRSILEPEDFYQAHRLSRSSQSMYLQIDVNKMPFSISDQNNNLRVFDDHGVIKNMIEITDDKRMKSCIPIWLEDDALEPTDFIKCTDSRGYLVNSPSIFIEGTIFIDIPSFGAFKAVVKYNIRLSSKKIEDSGSLWIVQNIPMITPEYAPKTKNVAMVLLKVRKDRNSEWFRLERIVLSAFDLAVR